MGVEWVFSDRCENEWNEAGGEWELVKFLHFYVSHNLDLVNYLHLGYSIIYDTYNDRWIMKFSIGLSWKVVDCEVWLKFHTKLSWRCGF